MPARCFPFGFLVLQFCTLFFLASMGTDVANNVEAVSFILIMLKMIFVAPWLARPLLDFCSLLYVTHLRMVSL